jgi:hypothetical protein
MTSAKSSQIELSQGLAMLALVFSAIYVWGAPAIFAGFMPLLPVPVAQVTLIVLLLGATALSIASFILSSKKKSVLVLALLTANGVLVTLFGIIASRYLTILSFPGPIIPFTFGLGLLAIGLAKGAITASQEGQVPSTTTKNKLNLMP